MNGGAFTSMAELNVVGLAYGGNVAPYAADDAYLVYQDSQDNAMAVLVNDTDANEDILSVATVGIPDNGGTAIINGGQDGRSIYSGGWFYW